MVRPGTPDTDHPIARMAGVTANDTKVEAAEKAIAMARSAGLCTRRAERMLADYKKRNGL